MCQPWHEGVIKHLKKLYVRMCYEFEIKPVCITDSYNNLSILAYITLFTFQKLGQYKPIESCDTILTLNLLLLVTLNLYDATIWWYFLKISIWFHNNKMHSYQDLILLLAHFAHFFFVNCVWVWLNFSLHSILEM